MPNPHLTLEEATEFFSTLYFGQHHIPHGGVKPFGSGFCVKHVNDLSTFDGNFLTRFVIECHDKCYRGSIHPYQLKNVRIVIWKRSGREGSMSERHPTLEDAIKNHRGHE